MKYDRPNAITNYLTAWNHRHNILAKQIYQAMKHTRSSPFSSCSTDAATVKAGSASTCFSISIGDSQFDGFNWLFTDNAQATFVDPTFGMEERGTILSLKDFKGPVYFNKNTVISIRLYHSTCDVTIEMNSGSTASNGAYKDNYSNYGTKSHPLNYRSYSD